MIVKELKSYDLALSVLHKDDLIGGLLAHGLLRRIAQPHRERVADRIVDYFDLVHIVTPAFMASVGYAVIRNPDPSARRATAQSQRGDVPR